MKRRTIIAALTISTSLLLIVLFAWHPIEGIETKVQKKSGHAVSAVVPNKLSEPPNGQAIGSPRTVSKADTTPSDQAFEDARECMISLSATDLYERQLKICREDRASIGEQGKSDWEQQRCDRMEAVYPARITETRAILDHCGPAEGIGESYFYATESAARNGNIDAQACYANAIFDREGGWSASEKLEHQEQSAKYINSGLERGDWRMVGVLFDARHRPFGMPNLPSRILGYPTPSKLQINRLLRLGLENQEDRKMLDLVPAGVGEVPSPSDMREAEEWALRIYQLYFTKSEKLKSPPEICPRGYDEIL